MKERPILFSAPMVRAILKGQKTQTRRIIKDQTIGERYTETLDDGRVLLEWLGEPTCGTGVWDFPEYSAKVDSPYGKPGDQLWVRETFSPIYPQDPTYNGGLPIEYDYAATYKHGNRLGDLIGEKKIWKPSIHMPRWASRIQLEITGIRVERLQDTSEEDARAEGVEWDAGDGCRIFWVGDYFGQIKTEESAVECYKLLWESINGAGSWDANPWVWVVEFKVIKP